MNNNLVKTVFDSNTPEVFRANIQRLEEALLAQDDVILRDDPRCPLTHRFADGLYCREIFIPAGIVLTTGIHAQQHIAIISQGKCIVATDKGTEYLSAPHTMITEVGTKRAILVLEDLVWTTVHATEETDLDIIMSKIEAKSFAELEQMI